MELKKQLDSLGKLAKDERWHIYRYMEGVAGLIEQAFVEMENLIKDFEKKYADKIKSL